MRIAVAAQGPNWGSDLSAVFGRSPYLLLFDTETGLTQALENPGATASGGAGIEAAQLVVSQAVDVLVTPKVGPKAHDVLDAAGVRFRFHKGGTAGEALEEARRGELV